MPTYFIDHRIDTLAELWGGSFMFDGLRVEPWSVDMQRGRQSGWIAKAEVEADTIDDALRDFFERFYRLVDRVGFIAQCHTAAELETFRITKPNDRRFFWRFSRKQDAVPLHFNEAEIKSLLALEEYELRGDVFRCLREAVNATSFYTRFAMLVAALEAIAGQIETRRGLKTNRAYISDSVLKDRELCDKIFRARDGIRNQMLHGSFVDSEQHGYTNYNQVIYDAVVDYFNEQHGLEIDKGARGAPRSAAGSYRESRGWWRLVAEDPDISLQKLCEIFDQPDSPSYFTLIDTPDDF